jgi:hypothetical protein
MAIQKVFIVFLWTNEDYLNDHCKIVYSVSMAK